MSIAIYCDGQLLHSVKMAESGRVVLSPTLTQELNEPDSLDFTVPPGNPMYGNIQKLKSTITVYQDGECIFSGRCLTGQNDFYKRKKVSCEGAAAYLVDSVTRPYEFTGDIPEFVNWLLKNHNEQVTSDRQFTLGELSITDSNNYINRSNNAYSHTHTEILDKLIGTHGGYLRTRTENGVNYLDLTADSGQICSQVIEFGRNLLDITEYIDAKNVFTVLIPLGAEQEDGSRLGIASVNGGKDYIENEVGTALFGRIWKTETWDDVTLPENLLTKGKARLDGSIQMAVTLKVKAFDLRNAGVDVDRIAIGCYVRVVSIPHRIDSYFQCIKIIHHLDNPGATEYVLGAGFTTLTDRQVSEAKAAAQAVISGQGASGAAQSAQADAAQANATAQAAMQVVAQMPFEYVKAADFEVYKQELAQKITTVYRYCGSADTYEELPETPEVGDVYNVREDGMNYAWTEEGWDGLGSMIDLSGYVKEEDLPVTAEQYRDILARLESIEGGTE